MTIPGQNTEHWVGAASAGPVFGISAWHPGRVICDFCGRREDDPAKTLTWSTAVENGRRRTFCDECSREHLRAMEGKLDSEWW